jgi:hypothetical protein
MLASYELGLMYEKMGDAKAASKYQRASQLEEIGYLTKEMMYNKYDDMKSLTIKKIKVKLLFLPKLWNILCKMARTMQCKEWNTIAEEIIQKQERWLGKVNQPFEPRTQAFENKRN